MTNRKDTHQSQGDQRKNAIKKNPENVIKNPALEYNGRTTDNQSLKRPMNSVGGGLANSANINNDNAANSDYNKAGHLRNQGENEQNANDNVNFNAARPQSKFGGKEGKTMVKNNGTKNNNEAL